MKKGLTILVLFILMTFNMSAQDIDVLKDTLVSIQDTLQSSKSGETVCDDELMVAQPKQDETYLQKEVHYGFALQRLNEWTIGPNPTSDIIQIFGDHDIIESIEIFSITGEMLMILGKSDASASIDLSFYPNGIYFVRIVSDYKVVKTYKVVKR